MKHVKKIKKATFKSNPKLIETFQRVSNMKRTSLACSILKSDQIERV